MIRNTLRRIRGVITAQLAALLALLVGLAVLAAPSAVAEDRLNFTGTTLSGAPFDGSSLQGKPAVLWFWAPWCPPCVEELPLINQQLLLKPNKKIQLLAIAIDDLDQVQRFWRARQLPAITPVVAGYAGMQLMRQLGNEQGQLPFTVVLAADGAILHSHLGALKAADMQQIFALIEKT